MKTELFSLGELYPSDFLKEGELPTTEKVEMKLIMEEGGLVRLENSAPANKMYGKYWYRSGINATMKDALKDIVNSILKIQKSVENHIWLDIASNDGTLLSFVPEKYYRIGCDPAEDSFRLQAENNANHIIQDFFSAKIFKEKYGNKKANVITSIAMFYDIPNPKEFIKDVYDIMEDDGIWVMQLSYSPLMIKQIAFDNICHEHIYYYSLFNLRNLLSEQGLMIVDCELNDINGGSFRIYIRKSISVKEFHDVNYFRIQSLLCLENALEIDKAETWKNWFNEISSLKEETVSFIKKAKSEGKTIWAYGASTKGNTLLQFFELDNTIIDGIAERNRDKWGLRTIGTNIPIYSEDTMRNSKPDYLLILPWHFQKEFIERENEYLQNGGTMIFPCPKFELITK